MYRYADVRSILTFFQKKLEQLRLNLSRDDAILSLSMLGLIAGILAAVSIIAFRLLVEQSQLFLYPIDVAENFEAISSHWRFIIPVTGGILVALLFRATNPTTHTVGVLHVMERLAYHQGRLPWKNAMVQFFGGAISMICGHSVGREGPSAHLGATSSNLPAQGLGFPNNSIRIIAASGAAAGIAASFNTPLAGAVFAMEVLLMEYTMVTFLPIIMATVSATALTRIVFGHHFAYSVPPIVLGNLTELVYVFVCGIILGLLAGSFNQLFQLVSTQAKRLPSGVGPIIAGIIVGLCGVLVPQVMGIGDDTVSEMLKGHFEIGFLLLLLVIKSIASIASIGLGLPGGVIGPTLFVGAAAGGVLGIGGAVLGFNFDSSVGLYVMIGMTSVMAGSLMAPVSALIAILELTGEPNILLPGMLAIVTATITSNLFQGKASLYHVLLSTRGLVYHNDPLTQSLRRIGVASIMNRRIAVLPVEISAEEADKALSQEPAWILLRDSEAEIMLPAIDLVHARKESPEAESYNLLKIPGERTETAPIDMRATLEQAYNVLSETGRNILYVVSQTVPGIPRVNGVITRDDIENSYRYKI